METRPQAVITRIATPIGEMIAGATDTHLLMFEFEHRRMYQSQLERVQRAVNCELRPGDSLVFALLREQLDEYFPCDRRDFDLPLDMAGEKSVIVPVSGLQRM